MNYEPFVVTGEKNIRLCDYDPGFTGKFAEKENAERKLKKYKKELQALQQVFYAQHTYALLIVLQGTDTSGKDSVVKYVMSGVNPQGCSVVSFKAPSSEELDHDFLWRCVKVLPRRGHIGIFNRSYYEELLVVRVHPELLEKQHIPEKLLHCEDFFEKRCEDIRNFEKYLTNNGILVLKFFLNESRGEQKNRFFERIEKPHKNYKFSLNDAKERAYWPHYQRAAEDMINNTSTAFAPWHPVPADHKWFSHLVVASAIINALKGLNLQYPVMSQGEHKKNLAVLKEILEKEVS